MKRTIIYLLLLSSFATYGQTNLKQVLKGYGVEGSITIYNRNKRLWLYSDSLDALRETLPASTFDIINSGIALETGAIKTEMDIFKWDGKSSVFFGQKMAAWNKDTDLKTAFKNSNVWFYEALAKKIGRVDYLDFLKGLGYTNLNLSEKGNDFWNYGRLGISPKKQINFLWAFSSEQLSFSPRTFRIVKELMLSKKTSTYALLDKTGWTKANGKNIGWYVGYVERKDNTYYFATRLSKPLNSPEPSVIAKEITLNILKKYKIID